MKSARQSTKVLNRLRSVLLFGLLVWVAVALRADSFSVRTIDVASSSAAGQSNRYDFIDLASTTIPVVERLPRVLITIRPTGFDPAEVTLLNGRYLLAVDNKTGLDVVTLRLTREDGGELSEIQLSSERQKLRAKLTLPAGNYVLTEANHPNWRCRLTVAL